MARIKKYERGDRLSFVDLNDALSQHEYVFWSERPCHPSFIMSMKYNTVSGLCRRGVFYRAIISQKWLEQSGKQND